MLSKRGAASFGVRPSWRFGREFEADSWPPCLRARAARLTRYLRRELLQNLACLIVG